MFINLKTCSSLIDRPQKYFAKSRSFYKNKYAQYFLLTSSLGYNCFSLWCQLLLYNKMKQLYIYIYPHIPSLLCLPTTLPILPVQVVTKHGVDLCAMQLLPTSQLFYIWQRMYVNAILSLRPTLPFPLPVSSSPFSTSMSLFLPCPQVLQNHYFFIFYFFQSPYICVSIRYSFFSF